MKCAFATMTLIFLLSACTTSPVTPTRHSREEIDSIFQHQTVALQPQIDSICNLQHISYFQAAVDSMMHARQSEMDSLVK